jgi:hypothetical protein
MTLESLIRRFRVMTQDKAEPYLFADEDVTEWINEAIEQAAVRGRLIMDDTTTEVCRIDLTVGTQTYPLHEAVFEIVNARLRNATDDEYEKNRLSIVSREWLDEKMPYWRTYTEKAKYVIQDDKRLRLVGTFAEDSWIELEVYRLPLCPLVGDYDEPEIHKKHHEKLLDWAYHQAYMVPDTEVFDPEKSRRAEQDFTAYFGIEPDSDLRRITRHDIYHQNTSVLP